MIGVLDYGCGNINSVIRMIEKLGGKAGKVSASGDLASVDKLIIPGVGAFDHGMRQLRERALLEPLAKCKDQGMPILGICLGMQLMCLASEEGTEPGLQWIAADVKRFVFPSDSALKVPHMGWSELVIVRENALIEKAENPPRFYFVHSYKVEAHEAADVIASANYGGGFCAAFQRGNVMGVQFHPEKSHQFGFSLMRNFMAI